MYQSSIEKGTPRRYNPYIGDGDSKSFLNLQQADVAPLFGGKTRVSEVLNSKRTLTLKMITLLNRYLGIPLESLIYGNKEVNLEPEKKEKLLHVSSIKDYLSSGRAAVI